MLIPLQPRGRSVTVGSILFLLVVAFLVFHSRNADDVVNYVLKRPASECVQQQHIDPPSSPLSSPETNDGKWEFVPARDAEDYGLSREQCRIAFPKLFVEIEKSVAARKDKPITAKELNSKKVGEGMVRVIVHQGELYVVDFNYNPVTYSRGRATLSAIYRALRSIPNRHDLRSAEFIFMTEDYAPSWPGPIFAYSKRDSEENVWLMPDFAYWSWPEVNVGPYWDIRRRIIAVDDGIAIDGRSQRGIDFHRKKKQLFWRGTTATAPELRGQLMKMTEKKSWASVHAIDWNNEEHLRKEVIPMEDHCRYMFLMHTEGRSFSGRGKYLQNCRSVMVAHKLEWREIHHGALVASGPEANFVEVERDFSDLDDKMRYLIDHPEVAERIAQNSVQTFRDRYLTPAAEACYWRELIVQYASVCDFEPKIYSDIRAKKLRGVPFESWSLTPADFPY
ncbi:CAZyme family GT90 [Paecilomyces variotii]|nr:CAZyme family GT90 [Paecilomyces variotii]KAJ9281962.1 CAZyme family GT90 [Paecilomyces variotii]KAJ9341965.1 CAZyme family GT90 [Paecilomyces variotii]KAJ9388563.1 CAZyme family GT90 [Paecilomyces variotii]